MRLHRKNNHVITDVEAKILCQEIEKRGELSFPLSPMELGAVVGTINRAQRLGDDYSPSIKEKLVAKWNLSYASVASFALWIGVNNISIDPEFRSDDKGVYLKITLQSNNKIEWDVLKASAFRTPLI